jgi:hypothetical protein
VYRGIPHGDQSHSMIMHLEVYRRTAGRSGEEGGGRGERNEPPGD